MRLLRFPSRWRRVALAGIAGLIALLNGPVWSAAQRPLRIGFENNPPVQIRSGSGFSGLSVETVSEAAKRAGIQLQWVETGTSSEEALRKGLVDLWPLMADLPDRRKYVHFARPWIHTVNELLTREGVAYPDREFKGRIAVFDMPLHIRLVRERFPEAQLAPLPVISDILKQVCTGEAAGGFLEARAALIELREKPKECASVELRVHTIPDLVTQAGVASTFESAGAADQIQRQIENMYRDGSLALLIAKYSYFGLDDTWASYERIREQERWRWLTWAGVGILFVAGITLWMASSLRQRKRAEVALRESEGRFRNLANTAPVMIVASGADGHATFFNKTWLDFTGRTMEQELGYGWIESVHPEDRAHAFAKYSTSIVEREHCNIEYRLRRADGEHRYMICTGVPRFEPAGVFAGYIASCVDLTDIKSAQQEASARQSLESLGVLAGGIAHDFNNLLGGILAMSELAQVKLAECASPEEELRQISTTAIRGSEIVRQLMIFAGNESGTLEPVDVSSLVTEMIGLMRVSISKRAILTTRLDNSFPTVRANPAQIRQVVMNLVINASEAIGNHDGEIRVVTERVTLGSDSEVWKAKNLKEGDYLQLEVSDTGCGMTPETQRRAFDPFFTTKFSGRGMGLAVVHQIVHQLGGAIHVVSSVAQGTRVLVLLPWASETIRPNGDDTAAEPVCPVHAQIGSTVLVVEDEPVLLAAISKMLLRKGFSVMQATNGTVALELMQDDKNHIDSMLLDLTLPGIPSRDLFERAGRLRPDLVVILTSAYSQESVGVSFAGLSVPHFIRKPFRIEDLVDLLQRTRPAPSDPAHAGPNQRHHSVLLSNMRADRKS
jgi:PAS domain S-box-containing protein